MQHISLIAGNGTFPVMFVRAAQARGVSVGVVGLKGEADPALAKMATAMRWVDVGQLQALVDALLAMPGREVAFAGGVRKTRIFTQTPDARTRRVLGRLLTKQDDGLLRALARELEGDGLRVVASTLYLAEAMASEGPLTRRLPTDQERADLDYGFALAKQMGAADVGQTVVVKDRMPIAIEAIEGTDECILRGGKLSHGGAVVVKTLKPGQDVRFDLPAVGPGTLKTMRKAGARALGLEAGQVLLIERERTLQLAEKLEIAVFGMKV